jgi:hypothetical protein
MGRSQSSGSTDSMSSARFFLVGFWYDRYGALPPPDSIKNQRLDLTRRTVFPLCWKMV